MMKYIHFLGVMVVSGDEETERVSRHAIESQQTERIRIIPIIEYFVLDDSFSASRAGKTRDTFRSVYVN